MKILLLGLVFLAGMNALPARAADEVVTSVRASDGETVRYVLTSVGTAPHYAVILMPGGNGRLRLQRQDGRLTEKLNGNFLIRSRGLFADSQFVAASTGATSTASHILAIVQDLNRRYGRLAVYVIGTSRSTQATQALVGPLDGQVAGFVHTSSMDSIATLDPHRFRSRQLLVAHTHDACHLTHPSAAEASHRNYGTELIVVDGGSSVGDDCGAWAHHGYNGIERETVDRIKAWIRAGT
jgi:hypothetical protein